MKIPEEGKRVTFDQTFYSSTYSGDARGNDLWQLETFISNDPQGRGSHDTISTQTLTRAEASTPLEGGSALRFRNLEADIPQEKINCDETQYLCSELSQNPIAQGTFTMDNPPGSEGTIDCVEIKCAKPGMVVGELCFVFLVLSLIS